MIMLQNAIQEQQKYDDETSSPTKQHSSPVKGVMAALTKPRVSQEPLPSMNKAHIHASESKKVPKTIEEVPFRRQDRRILNARKKRVVDKQVIKCSLLITVLILALAVAFIVMWIIFKDDSDFWFVKPFIVIGCILFFCGLLFVAITLEVYFRLRANTRRVQDPEVLTIVNLHQIKHWMDPELIPFGWGQAEEDEVEQKNGSNFIDYDDDRATLKDDNVYAGNPTILQLDLDDDDDDNPHITMAAEMRERAGARWGGDNDTIPPDIFDESLRYSAVDRPSLSVRQSSPIPQRRGSFIDPTERIANLFSSSAGSR